MRARIDGTIRRLDEDIQLARYEKHTLELVIDRLELKNEEKSRFTEGIEKALRLAEGLVVLEYRGKDHLFSQLMACPACQIALQEMDREKRRLISGGILLLMGGILMIFALLASEIILIIWMQNAFDMKLEMNILIIALINIFLAGLSLRLGGQLAKGPYLPETLEGITKTTKAVLGKN